MLTWILMLAAAPQGACSIAEAQKLVPADNASDDRFGLAVDVDRDRIAVAAPTSVSGNPGEGVYVFVRNGATWTLEQKITAPNPSGVVVFGAALDLEDDALVASSYRDIGGCDEERAFLFRRVAGQWTLEAAFDPPVGTCNDRFGGALALDGETLVVGAREWGTPTQTGAAFLYRRTEGAWGLEQSLLPEDLDADDEFGASVDKQGDTLVVGAPLDDDAGLHAGAVYLFKRFGTEWLLTAKIIGDEVATRDDFGIRISLDAHRLAVAAPGNAPNFVPGSVYVFVREDNTWNQEARFSGSDIVVGDAFGNGLRLVGNTLVAGARLVDGLGASTGAAYVFQREGPSWIERTKIAASDGAAADNFGLAVGLDRGAIVVGAPFDDHGGTLEGGSAYVFANPLPSAYCTTKPGSSHCFPSMWASGVASASASPFVVHADQVRSQKNGLLFYSFGATAQPFLGGTLCVAPPLRRTLPQGSGGTPQAPCSGQLSFDFDALIQSGADPLLVAGAVVYAQYWFRDPGGNQEVGLSNGLRFELCP